MKTLGSTMMVAFLAVSSASFVAGCGCEAGNNSNRTPVDYTTSSVTAVRTPSTCGVTDPQYTTTDNFTLLLTGDTGTDIGLALVASTSVNEATPLTVAATNDGSSAVTAASADGSIRFSFTPSTTAAQIDSSPLTSIIATATAIPLADGQPLSAELHLTFEDGRVLDQVFTAPVTTTSIVCSH